MDSILKLRWTPVAVELCGMFRYLRQGRHWKQMQRNPWRIQSSDFILSHCLMMLKYFWHPLWILIMRRRNYALLKSKICTEWKGTPLKIVFRGTAVLWLLDPFHILFNSFGQIHSSLNTDTAMDWFLARTALKGLWTENKIMIYAL